MGKRKNQLDLIEVFDMDGRWNEIKPHLRKRDVVRALNVGMTAYCQDKASKPAYFRPWDPAAGPWKRSGTDSWCHRTMELAEAKPGYQELMAQFAVDDPDNEELHARLNEFEADCYPQPGTPDWYRCWSACHWLAGWNCALGKAVLPRLDWRVLMARKHSNSVGIEKNRLVFMDILWCGSETPAKIWQAVQSGHCMPLDQWLIYRPTGAISTPQTNLRDLAPRKLFANRRASVSGNRCALAR